MRRFTLAVALVALLAVEGHAGPFRSRPAPCGPCSGSQCVVPPVTATAPACQSGSCAAPAAPSCDRQAGAARRDGPLVRVIRRVFRR